MKKKVINDSPYCLLGLLACALGLSAYVINKRKKEIRGESKEKYK